MKKNKLSANERNLIFRYLLWCYKTTKEELDRVDRYFTQDLADRRILDLLLKNKVNNKECGKKVADFQLYMDTKQKNALSKKYLNVDKKSLQPDYEYLKLRFAALEQVIVEFLGKKKLQAIRSLYENEMTRRILEAKEHP